MRDGKKIYIIAAIVLTAIGCSRNSSTELGPVETIEAFCNAIFSGDFDKAKGFCIDTGTDEYIARLQEEWTKSDECIKAILPEILSEIEVKITDIVKNGQDRTIFYKLTTTDGQSKGKIAILRKEERAWKITAITDRH